MKRNFDHTCTPTNSKNNCESDFGGFFTLENICLKYVVGNVKNLDSLIGLPDIMGEKVFRAFTSSKTLNSPSEHTVKVLRIFDEAFKDLVLNELNFSFASSSSFHSVLTRVDLCSEAIMCFKHLSKLDLSGCNLGNAHPIMDYIARLTNLKHLYLKNNDLNCEDIRRLTTVIAVYNAGLINLIFIDLSNNVRINDKASYYLSRMKRLQTIILTGTSITNSGIIYLKTKFNFSTKTIDKITLFEVGTSGWAADLVNYWKIVNLEEIICENKFQININPNICWNDSNSFYKRRKVDNTILSSSSKNIDDFQKFPELILSNV